MVVTHLTERLLSYALGRRVAIRIPYDPLLYLRAANQGNPVFSSAPTSQPARRFDQLAAILLGEDAPSLAREPRRRGRPALPHLRRDPQVRDGDVR